MKDDILFSDVLATIKYRVLINSPAKEIARIEANGDIWIDPEITLEECKIALYEALKLLCKSRRVGNSGKIDFDSW